MPVAQPGHIERGEVQPDGSGRIRISEVCQAQLEDPGGDVGLVPATIGREVDADDLIHRPNRRPRRPRCPAVSTVFDAQVVARRRAVAVQ